MKKARLAALTLVSMMVLSQAAWADNVIVAPNPSSGGTAVTSTGSTGSVDTSNGSVITSVGPTSEKVLTEKGYLVYSGNELMAGNTYSHGVGPGGSTGGQVQTQTTVESTATQSQPAGTGQSVAGPAAETTGNLHGRDLTFRRLLGIIETKGTALREPRERISI